MLPYVVGMIFSLVIFALENTKPFCRTKVIKHLTNILFVYLLILSIFRDYSVGADLYRYVRRYELIGASDNSLFRELYYRWGFEYGFLFVNKVLSYVCKSPRFFIAVTSIFILCTFYWFLRKYSLSPALSIYFLILFVIYQTSFNLIRMFLAISVCCIAMDQLIKEKKRNYITLVLIAFLLHTSALVYLIMLPLRNIKLKPKHVALTIVVSVVSFFVSKRVLVIVLRSISPFYADRYIDKIGSGSGGGMLLMLLVIFLYCYIFRTEGTSRDRNYNIWLNMLLISVVLNIYAFQLEIAARTMWYYKIGLVLLIPNSVLSAKRNYSASIRNYIFTAGCLILPLVYFISMMNTDTAQVVPYVASFTW